MYLVYQFSLHLGNVVQLFIFDIRRFANVLLAKRQEDVQVSESGW